MRTCSKVRRAPSSSEGSPVARQGEVRYEKVIRRIAFRALVRINSTTNALRMPFSPAARFGVPCATEISIQRRQGPKRGSVHQTGSLLKANPGALPSAFEVFASRRRHFLIPNPESPGNHDSVLSATQWASLILRQSLSFAVNKPRRRPSSISRARKSM